METPFKWPRYERNSETQEEFAELVEISILLEFDRPVHGEGFLQPFFQAVRRAGIDALQLPEDFLEFRFGLRVAGQRVRVTDSPVRTALDALRQMLFHVPPLLNLAALHFGAPAEHSFDPGAQSLGPVDHEQVASLWRKAACHQYNLGIQQQLPWGMVLTAGYVGSRGLHLYQLREANPVAPVALNASGLPFMAAGMPLKLPLRHLRAPARLLNSVRFS